MIERMKVQMTESKDRRIVKMKNSKERGWWEKIIMRKNERKWERTKES